MSTDTLITSKGSHELMEALTAKHKALAELQEEYILQMRENERIAVERRAEYDRIAAERQAEYDKRQAEYDKRQAEYDKRREEADKRYDRLMEESRLEYNRQAEEYNRRLQETDRIVKETTMAVGALSNKIGEVIEKLVGEGNLVNQFRDLGIKVKAHSRYKVFGEKGTAESGQIDLFMEDGDVAILVEVKTTLKMDHVVKHLKQMEKYRRFVDVDGKNGKRFIGAVAGTVITENVINFAHDSGLYVIIQSARAVEIIDSPAGFVAKEW
jgi:ATPase subunit of ABC transporter with duplicated ATPase domains